MGIFLAEKNVGETPLQALERFRVAQCIAPEEKMTYVGRLDPMAEGVFVILSGEDRYLAPVFQKSRKTYRATFLLDFSSDSGDALGIPTHAQDRVALDEKRIRECVHDALLGEHVLPLPAYAAYKVRGKPMHTRMRGGDLQESEIPKRMMRVFAVSHVQYEEMSYQDVWTYLAQTITSVQGDFRQDDILSAWHALLAQEGTARLVTCTMEVASGVYVRSLACVLADALHTSALVLKLHRTHIEEVATEVTT